MESAKADERSFYRPLPPNLIAVAAVIRSNTQKLGGDATNASRIEEI